MTQAYREAMKSFAGMDTLALWYARIEVDEILRLLGQHASKKQTKRIDRDVARARTKDSLTRVREADAASSTASRESSATRR